MSHVSKSLKMPRAINFLFLIAIIAGSYCIDAVAGDPGEPPRVLLLFGQPQEAPFIQRIETGIRKEIESKWNKPVTISSEYLDIDRLNSFDQGQEQIDRIVEKYASSEPDIVIPVQDAVSRFFMQKDLFPKSAVVFCSILESTRRKLGEQKNQTGAINRFQAARTAESIHEMIPSAQTLVVITGASALDGLILETIQADLADVKYLQCEYWTGLSTADLSARVRKLPTGHVVMIASYLRDSDAGITSTGRRAMEQIASVSNVPVFGIDESFFDTGIVGGCIVPANEQGKLAGEIAARILKGESPASIPFSGPATSKLLLDWMQFRKWGFRNDHIPAGAMVTVMQEQTVWEAYRGFFIAGAAVVVLQSVMIVGLLINRRQRRRAEEALAASRNETRKLAGRILTAQEEERKRIARELHDDISQRIAASAIEVGRAESETASSPGAPNALAGLRQHLATLSDDVHRLSRQLHPAILDDLGLVETLRAECDRAAERGHIPIEFRSGALPADLSKESSLCIYRIAQEALNNANKYSQSPRISVALMSDLEFVELEVRDFGVGFDVAGKENRPGLGLASMRERANLAGGELLISSNPGQGTTIQLRIPHSQNHETDQDS
jgi:signal transduction histidine kinase